MRVCPQCGREYRGEERFCSRDGSPLRPAEDRAEDESEGEPSREAGSLVGREVADRYRVIARLGEGTMGEVYLARHEALGRQVAIKLLRPELADEVKIIRRFLLEARAACQVDHRNIVSIFDFGQDRDGRYFLVMEYVEGRPLRSELEARGPVEQPRVIHLLEQILSALVVAHGAGIVHRDLKPENIICTARLDDPDFVKILDFGLAKLLSDDLIHTTLTRAGCVVGTPAYMSPEQATGQEVDARSDLYAVGLIAYELLTSYQPFYGQNLGELIRHHVNTTPRPLRTYPAVEVHPDLELLVMTLLAKSPDERFQSAEASLKVLAAVKERFGREPLPEEEEDVAARTRTALQLGTLLAAPTAVAGPTVYRQPLTTAWEATNLVEELRRLGRLWARRVNETVDLLWESATAPPEVIDALAAIDRIEGRIKERETAIAQLRDEVELASVRFRQRAAEIRFERADLVARIGAARVAIRAGSSASSSMVRAAEEVAETLLPGNEGADPPLVDDPGRLSELLLELDREIDELDRQHRRLSRDHGRAVAEREQAILPQVDEVHRLEQRLGPLYETVAQRATEAARGRPRLRPYLTALTEVAGAIKICQNRLELVQRQSRG